MTNSEPNELSNLVDRLEAQVAAMFANPLSGTSADYLKKAQELSAVTATASAISQTRGTVQMDNLMDNFRANVEDLDGKLNTLESAVKMVEDAAAGIQAAADVIIAIRKLFGIPGLPG